MIDIMNKGINPKQFTEIDRQKHLLLSLIAGYEFFKYKLAGYLYSFTSGIIYPVRNSRVVVFLHIFLL